MYPQRSDHDYPTNPIQRVVSPTAMAEPFVLDASPYDVRGS